MCRVWGPFLEIKGELVLTSFQTFMCNQRKSVMQNKQIMIMKQMKRASKKGKTLTTNKIPSSDDFRMNFRRLKLIESFL